MSGERLAWLPEGMKSLVDQGRLAGVVTMVARHGKVVEFEAAGKRDIAADLPMQKDSIFRIYSMTKPITGVAMMMLFEEGKWQLNDPVAKYVPEFANLKVYGTDAAGNMVLKDQTHPVTMRELMSHTGGFTYGFFSNTPVDKLQREADVLNVDITLEEFIKRVAKLPLNAQPGSEWHYSISVDIQGYIVEKLSGMPFDEFLEQAHLQAAQHGRHRLLSCRRTKLKRFAEFYDYDKDGRLQVVHGALNHDFSAQARALIRRRRPGLHRDRLHALLPDAAERRATGRRAPALAAHRGIDAHQCAGARHADISRRARGSAWTSRCTPTAPRPAATTARAPTGGAAPPAPGSGSTRSTI